METVYDFFIKPMDPRKFSAVKIGLASPERIREWSHGEIKKPETINYRTFKPEREGLFCAKIFGPTKDYECNCGKYKRMKHRGVICEKCGVEVIQSKVRRERMGHIQLATPVSHIWFLKSLPSKLGNVLDITLKNIEKVLYFDNYIVLDPKNTGLEKGQLLSDDKFRESVETYGPGSFEAGMGAEAIKKLLEELDIPAIYTQLREEILTTTSEAKRKKLAKRLKIVDAFRQSGINPAWMVMDVIPVLPPDLRPLVPLEGGRFATSDLNDLYRRVINRNNRLQRLMDLKAPDIIIRNEKRMLQEAVDVLFDNGRQGKVVTGTNKRPLKSLSDTLKGKQGRFRQNLLGKRVDYSGRTVITIGPNLRLHQCGLPKKMALELFKPFVYHRLEAKGLVSTVKSAKKLVERESPEVWDTLDEVVREYPVMLNRAPTLHRLGIQAFEPTLIEGKAIQLHPLVCTAFNADFDGDQMAVHVPLSLEAQIEARTLMLSSNNILSPANGAPIIVPTQDIVLGIYHMTRSEDNVKGTGKLFANPAEVRVAYDAGAVDLHAKIKLRLDGERVDTTVGRVLLWEILPKGLLFRFVHLETEDEKDAKAVADTLAANPDADFLALVKQYSTGRDNSLGGDLGLLRHEEVESVFRLGKKGVNLIMDALPGQIVGPIHVKNKHHFFKIKEKRREPAFSVANQVMNKKALRDLVDTIYRTLGAKTTVILSDRLKDMGYRYATAAGLSICINDMKIPARKWEILAQAQTKVEEIAHQWADGLITQGEKYNKVVDIWSKATDEVANEMMDDMRRLPAPEGSGSPASKDDASTGESFNPIYMMADSGARGSRDQMRQLAGMRGLMAKPSGEIIETPITANFREGLTVLQYFISTHGARKGLADTALKTANSGYLTRRLVDVAQDCVVSEFDCGTLIGVEVEPLIEGGEIIQRLSERVLGRTAAEDIKSPLTGQLIVKMGDEIDEAATERIEGQGVTKTRIRSVLTCRTRYGVCAKCYGRDLSHGKAVEIGQAVGILAAQSIGEPGTQLTMRTFHIGGTASSRVEQADIRARVPGRVNFVDLNVVENAAGEYVVMNRRGGEFTIESLSGEERERCPVIYGAHIKVKDGSMVQEGDLLAQWDPFTTPMLTEVAGRVKYGDIQLGKTMQDKLDPVTGKNSRTIIEYKDAEVRPRISIKNEESKTAKLPKGAGLARYFLPTNAIVLVEEGQQVFAGDIIAKLPRATTKTKDITGGLPRVAELFEIRKPKEAAILSEIDGFVSVTKGTKGKQRVTVKPSGVGDKREYLIPRGRHLNVYEGDYVRAGEPLMGGSENPQDILSIRGEVALARYLVNEVQEVYRLQGVRINDKHIEVIVRQMMRCVKVTDVGDTEFVFDEQVERATFAAVNKTVMAGGGKPAVAEPLILGITKASLSTESFISAASFQETTKVLTEASIAGAVDHLRGLKENVIMGRIIPAGTGLVRYSQAKLGLEQENVDDESAQVSQELLDLEASMIQAQSP